MGKKITIGNDTFSYVENGKYVNVYGYSHKDGVLKFTEESDGKSYFHIHIPETIEGLPVLVVDKLWLNVDYVRHYRHNGYDVVKIHLPENTAFMGLKKLSAGKDGVFVPNYIVEYYPRKNQLLAAREGAFLFYGEKSSETTCRVITIIGDKKVTGDWVWSSDAQNEMSLEKLVVPTQIDVYRVTEIYEDSTDALSKEVKEIHIPEGVEAIGDGCFTGLPFLSDLYLPKSLTRIGAGAFSYFECSRYIEKVPTLNVYYCEEMPSVGDKAFDRRADQEQYEEYADWGDMYTGTVHHTYEVVYHKK